MELTGGQLLETKGQVPDVCWADVVMISIYLEK